MDQIQNLLKETGEAVITALSEKEWDKIMVKTLAIAMFMETKGVYVVKGTENSFGVNIKTASGRPLTVKINELRKLMYALNPENGAWYSMTMTIENTGKFNIKYDYESKPEFAIEPSKEKYIAEVKDFPRSDEMTPGWLKQIINS